MCIRRVHRAGVILLGSVLACLGLAGGCGDSSRETGTQVQVDQKEQEDLQKRMQDFMTKKKAVGKVPKKGR